MRRGPHAGRDACRRTRRSPHVPGAREGDTNRSAAPARRADSPNRQNLTDPSGGQLTCADGGTVKGIFPNGNAPEQFCRVHSFLETDLNVSDKIDPKWMLHASVTNLFNQQPPVGVSTYGSGYPYNPSLHTAGAVGRYVNVGVNYRF